jgi:hypothetical protein
MIFSSDPLQFLFFWVHRHPTHCSRLFVFVTSGSIIASSMMDYKRERDGKALPLSLGPPQCANITDLPRIITTGNQLREIQTNTWDIYIYIYIWFAHKYKNKFLFRCHVQKRWWLRRFITPWMGPCDCIVLEAAGLDSQKPFAFHMA